VHLNLTINLSKWVWQELDISGCNNLSAMRYVSNEILIFIHQMRNTTKLKQILLKYDVDITMAEENLMKLTLVDKFTGNLAFFENSSYSQLLNKSYSYFLKELKKEIPKSQKFKA
jgi:hypothetical protein